LLLVSHDRAFLNNLVTITLVLNGNGQISEYVGGYDDRQRQSQTETSEKPEEKLQKPTETIQKNGAQSTDAVPRKRSYKAQRALETQKRELDALPQRIETLEAEQQRITAVMAALAFYQRDSAEIAQTAKRIKQLEEQLAQAYQRWEELEQL
jgi:ATP-binding cassette subfamily F protein uup